MWRLTLCVVPMLAPVLAYAEMPSDGNIKVVAEAWLAKKPAPGFGATIPGGSRGVLFGARPLTEPIQSRIVHIRQVKDAV